MTNEKQKEREAAKEYAMTDDQQPAKCQLCGELMPAGEQMFYYHGYSGPCPKPPLHPRDEKIISSVSAVLGVCQKIAYERGVYAANNGESTDAISACNDISKSIRSLRPQTPSSADVPMVAHDLLSRVRLVPESELQEAQVIIHGLARGDCFCEMGVGNPMVSRHDASCIRARAFLERYKEKG